MYELAAVRVPWEMSMTKVNGASKAHFFGLAAIALVFLLLGIFISGAYSADHRSACFDAGRKVGGAAQRVYDARVDGDEVVTSDQDTVTAGAPPECR